MVVWVESVVPFAVPGIVTNYVTGDRRASITVTNSVGLLGGGTAPALVDGDFTQTAGPLGSCWFNGPVGVTSADQLIFDFGVSGKIVQEARIYQSNATTQGTWQWYGSPDLVSFTAIGANFALGGTTLQLTTTLNVNITTYRYYVLQGVSGTRSASPFLEEYEFKQN